MQQVIEDVACTVCGCVCDDLRITVEGERIVQAENACRLAEPWFAKQHVRRPPAAQIETRPCESDEAVARAAEILASARSPLIYGLSSSSTPGQRAAVALADRLGATIDTTASACHASTVLAVQQVGLSTCTLGEVRNRADLVIYWGSDPVETHPRHLERYSVEPIGQFVPGGRADRTLVVIDVRPTETGRRADLSLRVEPGRDLDLIQALRCLVRGIDLPTDRPAGAPPEQLAELANRMKSCRYGVIFFGGGLTKTGIGHRTVEALFRMVRELNDHTRFHARRMRPPGDVAGADHVLAWQTGYPFAVNLSHGHPRYGPGEYSADVMLRRGEVDACLLVGSDAVKPLSPEARQTLSRIPVVSLDGPSAGPSIESTVHFTTAVYGVHLPGTAYRMDDVPVPLKPLLPSPYASDAEILQSIQDQLSK